MLELRSEVADDTLRRFENIKMLLFCPLTLGVLITSSIAYPQHSFSPIFSNQHFNGRNQELADETFRLPERRTIMQHLRYIRSKNTDFITNNRQDDTENFGVDESTQDNDQDKCNSPTLKKLMLQNIDKSTSLSKRRINKKAEELFGGNVDVICSKGHFSYIYSSNLYCETTKDDITCVAYRQVH